MTDEAIAAALSEADPLTRARRFDELGVQNADTRPGVGLRDGLPELLWRRVPAGRFWMGGDPLALGAWHGRSVDVSTDMYMAAYPVTNAQFTVFVGAGGYTERWRSVWSSVGWSWNRRYNSGAGLTAPPGWQSVLAPPRVANHPVEVTWYEADAFAHWLEQLHRDGTLSTPPRLPAGHAIRLPDEAEREWAARYPDGRAFPWGPDYVSGAANIDETAYGQSVGPHYLRRITPVGIYPSGRQSALVLYDLSGNVNEWCQSRWDDSGYTGDNDREGVGYRVVRGGHYHNGVNFARAASRTWGDPDPDDQYDPSRGFRLVIGPRVTVIKPW
jgi:formylglycine-generating enzyme required for sulfatase activity